MSAEEAEEVEGLLDHTEDPDDVAAGAGDGDGEDEVCDVIDVNICGVCARAFESLGGQASTSTCVVFVLCSWLVRSRAVSASIDVH